MYYSWIPSVFKISLIQETVPVCQLSGWSLIICFVLAFETLLPYMQRPGRKIGVTVRSFILHNPVLHNPVGLRWMMIVIYLQHGLMSLDLAEGSQTLGFSSCQEYLSSSKKLYRFSSHYLIMPFLCQTQSGIRIKQNILVVFPWYTGITITLGK